MDNWLVELRQRLVEAGYDSGRVDETITATLTRFRAARVRSFIPLLVERAVHRALQGD